MKWLLIILSVLALSSCGPRTTNPKHHLPIKDDSTQVTNTTVTDTLKQDTSKVDTTN